MVEGLSVAVLVNRAALAASLGDKATPDAMDKQVKEIEQLVATAAGLRKERGDTIKVAVVDFADGWPRPRAGRAAVLHRARCFANPAPSSAPARSSWSR